MAKVWILFKFGFRSKSQIWDFLRHSFATHLIENNTSREFVQAMLGHRSSSSTEVYIHVSNKAIMGVKSPLDLPQKKKPGRKKKSD